MKIKPVILAGGQGLRLWPYSQEDNSKQFLKIFSNKSLFQLTIERHQYNEYFDAPLVLTSESQRFIVAEQLREIGVKAEIIVEPIAKNTAPCVILSVLKEIEYEGYIAIIPTDHIISDQASYLNFLLIAMDAAEANFITTFGIKPDSPHTGYGYIEEGQKINIDAFKVKSFKEKPNYEKALEYYKNGAYLWNSGIFVFKAKVLIEQANDFENEMMSSVAQALKDAQYDSDFIKLSIKHYEKISANSIDYAIMEKSDKIAVIKADFGWSDLGSWHSLWEISDKDENNNAVFGNILLEEVSNSYIRAGSKLTAVLGVKDLIIVNTEEVTFVAHKDRSEDIKLLVNRLK